MLSTLHAVDQMRAWVPCSLLSLSMVPFATVSLGMGALSWVVPKTTYTKMDNTLYRAYMRLCLFVFENVAGAQVSLYGDVDVLKATRERALVISNHQTNVDWAVLTLLAARQGDEGSEVGFRVMVKHAIHFVPLFGWYIFQHGYIYVRRFGGFVGGPVLRQLKWLDELPEPFWLLIFPEGTRYSASKPKLLSESKKFCEKLGIAPLEHVLCPRSGGIHLALEKMPSLEAVYDVTIGYGQTRLPDREGLAPGMFEYVCGGQARRLCVHIKRYAVSDVPHDKEKLRQWTIEKYQEKDRMMSQFYKNGEFPDPVEMDIPAISIKRTLPPTLFFVGALIAPFYSEKVRDAYVYTIASFPLLIGWLHIRKCV